jgi:hypothetical protein
MTALSASGHDLEMESVTLLACRQLDVPPAERVAQKLGAQQKRPA